MSRHYPRFLSSSPRKRPVLLLLLFGLLCDSFTAARGRLSSISSWLNSDCLLGGERLQQSVHALQKSSLWLSARGVFSYGRIHSSLSIFASQLRIRLSLRHGCEVHVVLSLVLRAGATRGTRCRITSEFLRHRPLLHHSLQLRFSLHQELLFLLSDL